MLARVATFQTTQSLLAQSLRTQAKMAEAQERQSSGLKSSQYSGLDDVGRLLGLNEAKANLTADQANATAFTQTAQQMYSTLSSIADYAASMRSVVSAAISDGTDLSDSAAGWLQDLQTYLNTQYAGTYLFSGGDQSSAPVDLDGAFTSPDADTVDSSYYKGALANPIRVFFSDGADLALNVNASDSGFEKLLRAAALASSAGGDSSILQSAYDLMGEAIDEIGAAQERVSSTAAAATRVSDSATDKLSGIEEDRTAIQGADLATAAIEVTQYQTQLEAAFSSLSTLMRTNLLNYL